MGNIRLEITRRLQRQGIAVVARGHIARRGVKITPHQDGTALVEIDYPDSAEAREIASQVRNYLTNWPTIKCTDNGPYKIWVEEVPQP